MNQPANFRQSKRLKIIMLGSGVIAGLFLVFGLVLHVLAKPKVSASIDRINPATVISNGESKSTEVFFSCSAGYDDFLDEPATLTKCETDFGCSCTGETSCFDTCDKTFSADLYGAYTITVKAEDSAGNTASDSYDITVDTREFRVDSIGFTDSEEIVVDPRSSQMFITMSLPVDSIDASQISFNPSKAVIESCSSSNNLITCNLQKKGVIDNKDIYFELEDIEPFLVSILIGSATSSASTHSKPLKEDFASIAFHIGCVLRKVTLAAVEGDLSKDVLVGKDDLWGDLPGEQCNSAIGQEYRTVKLRQLDCTFKEVDSSELIKEMRGCQQTPVIIKQIIRTDYSDLFAEITEDDKLAGRASFGPLKSVLTISGDYFYPVKDTVCDSADWADRTFTEVWMGKNPAIKIAGIGCFSQAPYIDNIHNNDKSQFFVNQPQPPDSFCNNGLKDCTIQVQIRQETPECADKVEVKAVVQPKIYQNKIDSLKWDDGDQPGGDNQRMEKTGEGTFVVVPSTFDGSKFRGARFGFNWANQIVSSEVISYLNSIGAKQNQGVVGLPLSFTLENDYEDKAVSPRYCAIPNGDKTVCSKQQIDGGMCLCGFGRKNYQDNPTLDFIKIKFYNSTSENPDDAKKIIRPEKDVSLWEVGKPWNKFKIFPIAPFLDEEAKPGITRVYVCGNNIGFIESRENFELLQQDVSDVFAVSKVSPFWGDAEAGYPFVWGYNLKPKKGPQIIAKIDTWDGGKDISFVPIGPTYGYLVLPPDDLHPRGTALGDLKFCRDEFCVKSHQNIYKEEYHPAGEGRVPEIETASMLTNWQAQPFPIYEDIPYIENFCIDEEAVIQGSNFGEDKGQVLFWQDNGWSIPAAVSIESWSSEEIKVKIKNNSISKSADCAKDSHTLAEVSNLTLPAKICDAQGKCQISDQNNIKIIPPRRVHLVGENAPEKDNYCLDDRILITGLEFGEQRLGAKIKIAGQEAGRYIKWSDTEIIVTPPPIYGGRRSPFCPRTDERNKDGLLTTAKKSDQTIISCPNLPSGPRKCQISKVELVLPYIFQSAPVYKYQDDFKYFSNVCLDDKVEISGHDFGEEQGASRVEFWSNENGWDEASRYELWSDNKINVLPPVKSNGQSSPDCPRADQSGDKEGELSIFKGPLRACAGGECQYFGLDSTNVNAKVGIYKKTLTNKQYLVDEEVKITGRFFSDIRSEDEFKKSGALQNDKRNTGYVEFYSDEIGWAPAGEYVKWADQEIIAKAPKISLENKYDEHPENWATEGVSAAGQPVRVCTSSGCSTNLVNYQKPEIVESIKDGACYILKGFNFGDPDELGIGFGAYKNGDYWKEPLFSNWTDNEIRVCFQGNDTADILRFCRADEKCLFWDLGAKHEIIWHYPEVFSVSPICLPAKKAVEAMAQAAGIQSEAVKVLLTIYGLDLDEEVINGQSIFDIELSNGGVLSDIKIYDDSEEDEPKYKFRQQYYDRLVLQAPSFKVDVPGPPDPQKREMQAITGKLFLKSPFAHKNKIEVSNTITFSDYCQEENGCLNAPMIAATNNKAYVGEDKNQAASQAPDSNAIISGCNLGSGEGSSIAFGDVYQFNDLAARSNWQTNNINITIPFGAKSGFLAPNIWTGLLEYSGTNLLFNVLPTAGELGVNLGSTGQIVEIFGSDFCGVLGCADFLKDVYLGVWQGQMSVSPDLTGSPMRILDVSPRRVRVKLTPEDQLKTYGDVYANLDKMATSGQFLIKRGDDAQSPVLKTANFDSREFLDNPLYFTKAPVLKEILPDPIYKIDKNEVYFKGADYYGTENVSAKLKSYFSDYSPHGEFALAEPYDLADTYVFARAFQYPDLTDLKKEAYKQVPDYIWAWNEVDRRPYFDNPQSVILSNWDGAFSAWLGGAYKDPKIRSVYSIIEIKEQQCMVREPLSEPQAADMPQALPTEAEPLGIYKIDPLPLLDVCYFCQSQEIKISALDQTSFKADKGNVYFWSDSGWIEVQIISWSANEVRVKLTDSQDIKHLKCGAGKLTQARLPIKLCRKVDAGDPEECIVWRGPKTHIKIRIASGGVSQDYKKTLGRFNRLNLEQSLVFAGDNLIEKVFIDEDYSDNFGAVELFINKLYNDIKNDVDREELYANIFSSFDAVNLESGLIWIDEKAEPYQKGKFSYPTNLYNSSFRYLVCFDDECLDTALVYPEFEPEVGGFYQGKEIKKFKFFSVGWASDAVVRLEEGERP